MADTSIDITPGTGASVDTRTEATNGNHRQVMVIGDRPSTQASHRLTRPKASQLTSVPLVRIRISFS
jgi:hypothetical protein